MAACEGGKAGVKMGGRSEPAPLQNLTDCHNNVNSKSRRFSDQNNNDFSAHENCYQVRSIPGKGLGYVARRRLEPGHLVVQDIPVITLKHDHKFKEWLARGEDTERSKLMLILRHLVPYILVAISIYFLPPIVVLLLLGCEKIISDFSDTYSLVKFQDGCDKLYSKYNESTREIQERLDCLANVFNTSTTKERIAGIFCTNSFMMEDGVSGIFTEISRFNHSCRSNCSFTGETIDGVFKISVRVSSTVEKGEELTICYLDSLEDGAPHLTKDRQKYLQWAYRFECRCEDCELPRTLRDIEDQRRSRLVRLRSQWRLSTSPERDWVNIQEQIYLLLSLDSSGKLEYLVTTLELAWDCIEELENDGNARKVTKESRMEIVNLGVVWSQVLYGSDHSIAQDWSNRLNNLRKTTSSPTQQTTTSNGSKKKSTLNGRMKSKRSKSSKLHRC